MYNGEDPFVIGKPLAIEYNPAVFEDEAVASESASAANPPQI